jgi:hypothetical protein
VSQGFNGGLKRSNAENSIPTSLVQQYRDKMGSTASKEPQSNDPKQQLPPAAKVEDDDEPDDW